MDVRGLWPDSEATAHLRLVRDAAGARDGAAATAAGGWTWTAMSNGVIWTRQLRQLYGVSEDAPASFATFLWWVHPEDSPRVVQRLHDAAQRREQCYEIEYRIVRPDGVPRLMRALHIAAYDIFGMPIQRAGTVLDVTDRAGGE